MATKSQVTTFYSYKGGSGRSMTLANVAWALASNDEKVLAIDWDLEAPGLHRYFHPFLNDPDQGDANGLIDRVWEYVDQLGTQPDRKNRFKLADCSDIVQPLDLPVRGAGCLNLIDVTPKTFYGLTARVTGNFTDHHSPLLEPLRPCLEGVACRRDRAISE